MVFFCFTKNPNLKNKKQKKWVGWAGGVVLVNFIYKLTKNPNVNFFCGGGQGGGNFFLAGDGGEWEEGGEVSKQMFQMALLLFKESNCAKLF